MSQLLVGPVSKENEVPEKAACCKRLLLRKVNVKEVG